MKTSKFLVILMSILALAGCFNLFQELNIEEIKSDIDRNNKGMGCLAYEITLPEGLIKAELKITSISQTNYIGTANLLGEDKNNGAIYMVPTGNYNVTFELYQEDFTAAGKTETINIDKDKTTTLVIDFSNAVFTPAKPLVQLHTITESGPVTLKNLSGNQVYSVAINKNPWLIPYTDAGSIASYELNGTRYQVASTGRSFNAGQSNYTDRNGSFIEQGDRIPLQFDNERASAFNANPPPIPDTRNDRARSAAFVQPKVGDKRLFWVDDFERPYRWQEKQATLIAVSKHANVWIMDEYFDNNSTSTTDNRINTRQAIEMAEKFDDIYKYATPIFGYEYGGEPGSSQPGGVDGDMKVQILVYDIDGNNTGSGTIGYFWGKDYYTNEYLQSANWNMKSNNAEMFYIDSYFLDSRPDTVYSALIHEFIHLVNFNEKVIKNKVNMASWYTEMLAMLGEDIIGPMIGILPDNPGHPISMRIPITLGLYACDPFFWSGVKSYGVTFGFGAYLARNYGGAALVREIARNDKTNFNSITEALSIINPSVTFTDAIERYYEAFINNDTLDRGTASFNRTVTNTIAGRQYTLYGFDIFTMNRVNVALSPGYIGYWSTTEKGPFLYSLTQNFYMDYYSFILLSCADWQNVNGDMVVETVKPKSSSVIMRLAVR